MKRIARFAKSLSVVLFLAPPATTLAQELPSPGERVRVWGPVTSMDLMVNEKQETELSAIRGDTLVFEMPGSSVRVAVAQNRIRRLDVRRPLARARVRGWARRPVLVLVSLPAWSSRKRGATIVPAISQSRCFPAARERASAR
jgi:hypothetical protein